MSSKSTKQRKKSNAEERIAAKIAERKTAKVSRERLSRISKTKGHRIRSANRVMKYGAKSFVRNTWLSVAAIAIMTITLIIIAITVVATLVMDTAVHQLEERVNVSVYIRQSATRAEVENITRGIALLDAVESTEIISPTEASNSTIEMLVNDKNLEDESLLENLREAPVILPWTINVTMKDLSRIDELKNFVETDASMRNMLDSKEPTYDSDDRSTIENISNTTKNVQIVGFIAAGFFALIAILVVFNTIRMAIFNRKEEIYMMRLVGASPSFIVGPFLVEAAFYGVIAALIAGAVIYLATYALSYASEFASLVLPTFNLMAEYWYFVATSFLVGGVIIGVVSALLAARKYLRIK